MATYTVFVRFPGGGVEEIDVAARNARHARTLAEREIADDYSPGGRIIRIVERAAGWWFL